MKTQTSKIGVAVVFGGAGICLLTAFLGLGMMTYWHHVSGSWLDDRVEWWNPIVPIAVLGVFFFTRIVAELFDI